MLNCPFCDAELGAASNRLRGGRCPKCGSIVSWEDDQTLTQNDLAPIVPARSITPTPTAPPSHDEDALPMSEIVRTLVERGASTARIDATVDTPIPPSSPPSASQTPTMAFSSTFVPPPPPSDGASAGPSAAATTDLD